MVNEEQRGPRLVEGNLESEGSADAQNQLDRGIVVDKKPYLYLEEYPISMCRCQKILHNAWMMPAC